MTANDKARMLGLFFWLFTAFNVLVVVLVGLVWLVFFGAIFSQVPHKASDPPPELIVPIMAVVFVFIFAFTVLFSIPKLVAGYGLRRNRSWARTWAIVAAIMCCLSFPIGTAIGVFGLVFLFSDEGKIYFANLEQAQLAGHLSPPTPNSWQ